MTNPNDLIRRMDAMQACQVGPSDEWARATKDGYNQAATDIAMNVLRIPAATPPEVNALVAEYMLNHLIEGPSERIGRKNAVRGMAVRIGVYDLFCADLAAREARNAPQD